MIKTVTLGTASDALQIEHDDALKTITIYGVKYSVDLFRALAFSPLGSWFRIDGRWSGNVSIRRVTPDLERQFDDLAFSRCDPADRP